MPVTPDGRWPFVGPESWLDAIDDALIRPFPAQPTRFEIGNSRPDYHVLILQCSRDFWEERSAELFDAAEAEVEDGRRQLARQLACRWGPSEILDLQPYCRATLASLPLPEPLAYLGTYAADALIWRRPTADRWLALSIVKHDTELPFVLVAVVGVANSLVEPPSAQGDCAYAWPRLSLSSVSLLDTRTSGLLKDIVRRTGQGQDIDPG